jgi:hypothetical protein
MALLLYFEEALAGHIAFLAARGVIWSPAYVIWRRGGDLEPSLRCLGPAGGRLKGNLELGLYRTPPTSISEAILFWEGLALQKPRACLSQAPTRQVFDNQLHSPPARIPAEQSAAIMHSSDG